MRISETELSGLYLIRPDVYEDARGYFFESFNKKKFADCGLHPEFVQDNQSKSQKGVLRGLHFQNPPEAQGKLVQVIKGAVLDVVVDIRAGSPTYGKPWSCVISEKNKSMIYIPEGFAHGFLTLENDTIFSYKCTALYNPGLEASIRWNDPELNINWGISDPIVSEKDRNETAFSTLKSKFHYSDVEL